MNTAQQIALKPQNLGELFDRTFSLYRAHFWLFVGIMALPACFAIPMRLISIHNLGSTIPIPRFNVQRPPHALHWTFWAAWLLFTVVYALATGALTTGVADSYLGRTVTLRGAYGSLRGKLWRLAGVLLGVILRMSGIMLGLLVIAIAIIAGFIAAGSSQTATLIVTVVAVSAAFGVAIWFVLRYSVSVPVLILENTSAGGALRRSAELTEGRRGSLFLAALLASVFGYVGAAVFQGPFWMAFALMGTRSQTNSLLSYLMTFSGAVGAAITMPVLMILMVVFYYDLRIRKEGFDLQFMMASLDQPPTPSVAQHPIS